MARHGSPVTPAEEQAGRRRAGRARARKSWPLSLPPVVECPRCRVRDLVVVLAEAHTSWDDRDVLVHLWCASRRCRYRHPRITVGELLDRYLAALNAGRDRIG